MPQLGEFCYKYKIINILKVPDIVIVFIFTLIIGVITYLKTDRIEFVDSSIILPLGIIVFLTITTTLGYLIKLKKGKVKPNNLTIKDELKSTFRYWGIFALLVFVYENLRTVVSWEKVKTYHDLLMKIDIYIFGVEPTLWIARYYNPVLVDIMAFFYSLYFVIPTVVMFFLYVKRYFKEFHYVSLTMIIALFTGFIGYILIPASPPRFAIAYLFKSYPPLEGFYFHNTMQNLWDSMATAAKYCAFPSLHVGLSTVGVIWGIKFYQKLPFNKLLISIISISSLLLWFSTIYLRHHWFVDIIAGWVVAILASYLSKTILNKYYNNS